MGKILAKLRRKKLWEAAGVIKKIMKNSNPVLYGMGKRMKKRIKSSWKIVANI
jgi:hypothetical protein